MGQYHVLVNLDKRQLVVPTRLGDGLKLMEFGDGGATLTALAILLAQDNGRGLGDLHVAMPDTPLESWEQGKCGLKRIRTPYAHLVGSWAGDRIIIAGDYGDNLPGQEENLYYIAQKEYEDISGPMRELIRCDRWMREKFQEQFKWAESLKDTA
ncbi:MAG TPA: hypothetical protein VGY31_14090 [Terriglobia bacterium]|nr:hypothetical protein [Terriglobia bacterium]